MNTTELAKAVASELFNGTAVWLLLLATALFAGVGAYFGKYLGVKAANLATKEDFNSLQAQLGASTRLVESVKSEFGRADWVAREWGALRIKKIEELMTKIHECDSYLAAMRNSLMEGKVYLPTAPFEHAAAIAELYLPELYDAVSSYTVQCRAITINASELFLQEISDIKAGVHYEKSHIWYNYIENSGHKELIPLGKVIRQQGCQLLEKIVFENRAELVS